MVRQKTAKSRARWMRMETAEILKRFYFCERALVISQAGWLAAIAPLDVKTTIPRFLWEDAMTADAMRRRVLELHYPNRLMEVGEEARLVDIFEESINAPSQEAFILALAEVFKPALLAAYRDYLDQTDELADGPTVRFMRWAAAEKVGQLEVLNQFVEMLFEAAPEQRAQAREWAAALTKNLQAAGGLGPEPSKMQKPLVPLPGRQTFRLREVPARDEQFYLCRYYWPDIVDPGHPYGEGLTLRLRSAISHFNEVWAVESGGAILQAFSDQLPWEFTCDAARWTYDEARHVQMGYARLREWGFEPHEIPLGSYIYDSARGQDVIVRLGMLHYFETKNIGNKSKRAQAFAALEDRVSQRDMEFDWADETIHAHYGRRWHRALRELYPERVPALDMLGALCEELVQNEVAAATDVERAEIHEVARAMIHKAQDIRSDP